MTTPTEQHGPSATDEAGIGVPDFCASLLEPGLDTAAPSRIDLASDADEDVLADLLDAVLVSDPGIEVLAIAVDGVLVGATSRSFIRRTFGWPPDPRSVGDADRSELAGDAGEFQQLRYTCPEPGCGRVTYRVRHDARRPPSCPEHSGTAMSLRV
ncbi:hypothetical protein [Streptomyces luteogriseus]|uniref:hypothetical protein n=1 Tax=Streptomyces luteogriseus TaxID=68233 RepID=UPI0037A2E26D